MFELYPELEPFSTDVLQDGSGHSVYFEQAGNKSGIPVLFLHGGPGSGCNEDHRRYFNPAQYRIILFDQRGCHRSTPTGLIEHNTTADLLNDIEAIRQTLGIDQWVLFGGSWGATLALLYAEQYPQFVSGIILRGTFLARQSDFDWFSYNGVSRIFPDYWQEFLANFSTVEQADLLAALHRQVFAEDRPTSLAAVRAWSLWAGRIVTHGLDGEYVLDETDEDKLINTVKIEMHYAKNRYFIKEDQILNNISSIPDVPVILIHGRQDLTCLPESSWSVQQAIANLNRTEAELVIVPKVGHLASEATMVDALIKASDKLAAMIE